MFWTTFPRKLGRRDLHVASCSDVHERIKVAVSKAPKCHR
jgi:hypothetical protein